ncbi:MAG: IS3 family transposase, partial [Rhizobacter sp.]
VHWPTPSSPPHEKCSHQRLKSEYIHGKKFDTDQHLRQTLRTYISFYNHTRIHTSVGRMNPVSFELTKT